MSRGDGTVENSWLYGTYEAVLANQKVLLPITLSRLSIVRLVTTTPVDNLVLSVQMKMGPNDKTVKTKTDRKTWPDICSPRSASLTWMLL